MLVICYALCTMHRACRLYWCLCQAFPKRTVSCSFCPATLKDFNKLCTESRIHSYATVHVFSYFLTFRWCTQMRYRPYLLPCLLQISLDFYDSSWIVTYLAFFNISPCHKRATMHGSDRNQV